jgi:hypothetical protein
VEPSLGSSSKGSGCPVTNQTGIWESSELLDPDAVHADQQILLEILNSLPDGVQLVDGTYVLPNGRIWKFRQLGTSVIV